jgi:fatty-acyl-CoA synthase
MDMDAIASHGHNRASAAALSDLHFARQWTWGELHRTVNRAARWLIGRLGAHSRARVAVLAKNRAETVILQLACMRAGAIFVPFNWRLSAAELAALAADAEPALVFREDDLPSVPGAGGEFDIAAFLNAIAVEDDADLPMKFRQPWEATSTLLYTSGTSGRPKGVMLSEANVFWGGTNFLHAYGVSFDSVILCDMPLFHTAGLLAAVRTPLLAGGAVLISRGFDPALTLPRLADRSLGVTHYFSVPQMAQRLWTEPGFAPEMLHGLKAYATGGAPNPAAQVRKFIAAGIPMSDGFGMTETCSNFAVPLDDPARVAQKAGSIGLPMLTLQTRIVDDAGDDLPDGEVGELWLKGPSISAGYWRQPALTVAAFCDGWFRTGDLARRDADGYFFLVDRKKDMFISGGENVYPAEVEIVVAEFPGLADVAVIGVPDETWGEVGWAYVVPAAGTQITEADVQSYCAARLARYKVPKRVIVTDLIPRTASGKLQKHLLRAQAQAEGASA